MKSEEFFEFIKKQDRQDRLRRQDKHKYFSYPVAEGDPVYLVNFFVFRIAVEHAFSVCIE